MFQTFDDHADPSFGEKHLPLIRKALVAAGLDGLLIPHEDEYNNEYLPEANDRLAFATGFTGSAGAAVVMLDKAAMFTDGRYTLQVRAQVDGRLFSYHDLVEGGVASWLERELKPGQTVGYDARLHTPDSLDRLKAAAARAGASLVAVDPNPLDLAWTERPPQPKAPVVPHPEDKSGEGAAAKRARISQAIADAGADVTVLTGPTSLAWLFNIRGGDVIRSPLPLGQAIIDADGQAKLFLDPDKVTAELPAWLGNSTELLPPEALVPALGALAGQRVLLDSANASAWYFDTVTAAGGVVVRGADPCALPRATKNDTEIAGARSAHVRDGAAVAAFLHWLATEGQTSPPDEIETVTKLEAFRAATGQLRDLSFDTIAGAGPNGAVIHYRPTRKTNRRAQPGELLLVDSGAQYLDGTTDITRTVAIGTPSDEMRHRYTLVLKGHVALAMIHFPPGVTGHALDVLARAALWNHGLDYDHGTGHGVGSYLGVHEGPQRIARAANSVALLPGMILSNEPGYYKEGAYGIRIENLQVVTAARQVPGGERPMHGFETLTLAPFDRRLIDADLLTADERSWVDAYHARVLREIGPLVPQPVRDWLGEACAAL
jgi:Xaa-Pro aminopeptidase